MNDRLAAVSTISRLFFMGLCVLADREGRLEDRPRRLKEELLPYARRCRSINVARKTEKLAGTGFGEVIHNNAFQSRTNKGITPKVLKEIEEQKQEPSSSEVVRYDPEHRRLAETLREKILANKPDARVPTDLSRWSETMRLPVERDKRKKERIAEVIDWATRDPFWSGNILSADSLRRHFDRLELAMQRSRGVDSGGDAISRAAAKLERMGL